MKLSVQTRRVLMLALALMLMIGRVALASEGTHWSYGGESGPDHWGDLSPDYAACATGVEQSPVDIPADAALNAGDISFSYQPSAVNIVNNGHTVQVNYDPGSAITLNGVRYDLVQFHFHAHSEHALAGELEPMEAHLVHKNAKGGLAVVGVLLKAGSENPAYAAVLNNLPAEEGEPHAVSGASVDANQLLPTTRTYWRYNGSLTTPPCSEGVQWLVLNTPVELSDAQIAGYTAIYNANARPLQAFNTRAFVLTLTLPVTGDVSMTFDAVLLVAGALLMLSGLVILRRSRGLAVS
ncbi:MAG: carbonic anhydrase family protein [Anaerolineae bacterium]|uniref:carbonic anhydrase family protein n=1 Tax=Candidatus Amarolinea dominans TaxID=3140696 RepID=UPI0031364C33|nr:carbonic anhydrase family protein [Anaerolineae bacterium]